MTPTTPRPVYQLDDGDSLRFGPPMAGEARVKFGTAQGGSLTLVTLALQPAARIPKHRHQAREVIWCIQKGQGRSIIDGHSATVVPGAVIRVGAGQWFALRNTGTGSLVAHGIADQPGFDRFLQAIATAPDRLQDAAAAAGIEWLVDEHGATAAAQAAPLPVQPEAVSSAPAAEAAVRPHRGRRRRRGGRGRRGRSTQAGPSGAPAQTQPLAPAAPAAAPTPAPAPASGKPSRPHNRPAAKRGRGGFRRHERVKEVYMNGRWVKVSGEGPVIAGDA